MPNLPVKGSRCGIQSDQALLNVADEVAQSDEHGQNTMMRSAADDWSRVISPRHRGAEAQLPDGRQSARKRPHPGRGVQRHRLRGRSRGDDRAVDPTKRFLVTL
jgi:hypothetical protein